MLTFTDAIVANTIALVGLVVLIIGLFQKVRDRTERRHEENLTALTEIRLEISKLLHLDSCVDELKAEVLRLRERIHQLSTALQIKRETDDD